MKRRNVIILLLAGLSLSGLLIPACDKLVTETLEVTIAGHPTADFSSDVDSGCAPLTVSFSDLSVGPRTEWTWDFGDGDSSSDTNPVHIYDSAGTYTVSLQIVDDPTEGTDTEVKKRFIVVGHTIDSFKADIDSGCPGLQVQFTPLNYGGIDTWRWNFGDGTPQSADSAPPHTFNSVGLFTVTLTAQGDCGETVLAYTDLIHITECPVIRLFPDTTEGCVPLTVTFPDSTIYGDTNIWLSSNWDFGNGVTSTERSPQVTYDTAGTYTVTVTVTSTGGTSVDTVDSLITTYAPPLAAFSSVGAQTACISPYHQFQIKFINETTGGVDSVLWDFGDGNTDTAMNPIHAYVDTGGYTVKLEVWGPCGTDIDSVIDFAVLMDSLHSATFSITPETGTVGAPILFQDLSTGRVVDRKWRFGDGDSASAASISHPYQTAGTFEVSLEISNDCNADTVYDTVVITEPPPP
ncbi:MAG: PKD domain-containing protein [Candidatus Zixiibacteriota bacterium]|nr:MAG: PKD domain-containing protein [candidate division Zixibacteria bacterium]